MYYTVYDYFDVWKDSDGTWIVNNQAKLFDDLYISSDCTDKEILKYFQRNGYLTTCDMRKVKIENYGDYMELYTVKGHCPLYGIIANEE